MLWSARYGRGEFPSVFSHIPDTLFTKDGKITQWYFMNKEDILKKKRILNCSVGDVISRFVKQVKYKHQVVARVLIRDPKSNSGPLRSPASWMQEAIYLEDKKSFLMYMTAPMLAEFLDHANTYECAMIQKVILPSGARNWSITATQAGRLFLFERCDNVHFVDDGRYHPTTRTVTYENSGMHTEIVKVAGKTLMKSIHDATLALFETVRLHCYHQVKFVLVVAPDHSLWLVDTAWFASSPEESNVESQAIPQSRLPIQSVPWDGSVHNQSLDHHFLPSITTTYPITTTPQPLSLTERSPNSSSISSSMYGVAHSADTVAHLCECCNRSIDVWTEKLTSVALGQLILAVEKHVLHHSHRDDVYRPNVFAAMVPSTYSEDSQEEKDGSSNPSWSDEEDASGDDRVTEEQIGERDREVWNKLEHGIHTRRHSQWVQVLQRRRHSQALRAEKIKLLEDATARNFVRQGVDLTDTTPISSHLRAVKGEKVRSEEAMLSHYYRNSKRVLQSLQLGSKPKYGFHPVPEYVRSSHWQTPDDNSVSLGAERIYLTDIHSPRHLSTLRENHVQIPSIVKRLCPRITRQDYERLRFEQAFLNTDIKICQSCEIFYNIRKIPREKVAKSARQQTCTFFVSASVR
jgi:hypothetical protein